MALVAYHYHGEYQDASTRAADAENALKTANATITTLEARQRDVAALDAKYTKELANAKAENDALRDDVAAGRRRLRVNARCPEAMRETTGTTGVDNAGTAELTGDARQNYYRLRDGIATSEKMIRGLQEYVRTQCILQEDTNELPTGKTLSR
ncbi:TPA: lysis protein [Escherichia coli]